VRVHRALAADGYGLMVFDGYRPWAVTKLFWDLTPADKKVYVADPAKGSRHNRGCAVDLTLYDLGTGREVPMPSAYDESTERAHATYAGGTDDERRARDLLNEAMSREGFFVYPYEWWHYDWKDWREYPILDIPFAGISTHAAMEPRRPPAVSAAPASAAPPGPATGGSCGTRLVDLTWTFDSTTLYWPTSPSGFEKTVLHAGPTPGGYWYTANSFCAPEHGGTHFDAPIHFAEGRHAADEVPLEQLVGPAFVIDVSHQAASDPDYRLTTQDVLGWEQAHGRLPEGGIVLLRTGWGKRWPDRARYFGSDKPDDASGLHFPGYGADAARLLVEERHVGALGIDTASIDYGPSQDFLVHRIAMAANVPGFENVAHLEEVPDTGAFVAALPMKIAGGSGGPLRIVAFVSVCPGGHPPAYIGPPVRGNQASPIAPPKTGPPPKKGTYKPPPPEEHP